MASAGIAAKLVKYLPDKNVTIVEYIAGSASSSEIKVAEPLIEGRQLQFILGNIAGDTAPVINFKTRARLNVYGEFTTRAFTEFKTASSLQTLGNINQPLDLLCA